MNGFIMSGLLLFFSVMRFYKNRRIFKQLSRREWFQYIAGFLLAWAAAVGVIIGSSTLTDALQIGWLNKVLAIVFVLIGLALAGFIINKTLPEKLRQFYS